MNEVESGVYIDWLRRTTRTAAAPPRVPGAVAPAARRARTCPIAMVRIHFSYKSINLTTDSIKTSEIAYKTDQWQMT